MSHTYAFELCVAGTALMLAGIISFCQSVAKLYRIAHGNLE